MKIRAAAWLAFNALLFSAATFAQTSAPVTNTARITLPAGLTDANPADNVATVSTPIVSIVTNKTSDIGANTPVQVGQTITYTVTVTMTSGTVLGAPLVVTDTLGAGLTFGTVTSPGSFTCNAASPVVCSLPAGTTAGSYPVSYTATVNASATVSVRNSVVPSQGGCNVCTIDNPLVAAAVTYNKSVTLPSGQTAVHVGDSIAYTLTAAIASNPTTAVVTLTDTLGQGLTFGSVTSAGSFTCNAANPLVCTLPAAAPVGTYSLTYVATVNAAAVSAVRNAVIGTGGDNPACSGTCSTETPFLAPQVTYAKVATLPSGKTAVSLGDSITFTVSTVVRDAPTGAVATFTDTLGTGLSFGSVTNAGIYSCNAANPLVCTLPSGTPVGTYPLTYTATVNASASGSVRNAVVATGGDTPSCSGVCGTDTPFISPIVTYAKAATLPAGKTTVSLNDTIIYTLSATVAAAPTTAVLTLTDTLGTGLTFGAVTSTSGFTCGTSSPLVCTLPAATPIGTYTLSYTATVNTSATGTVVRNAVVGSGGDDPTCSGVCGTDTPFVAPVVTYAKDVTLPANKTEVVAGDTLTYTLSVAVTAAPSTGAISLTDTLGPGLAFGSVTSAGGFTCNAASPLICTLPAGAAIGTHALRYTATVTAAATGTVNNAVVATGRDNPSCSGECGTDTPVLVPSAVTYSKAATLPANKTSVSVGDAITYTLSVTVGANATTDVVTLTDTPGPGLTFGTVTSAGIFACNATIPLVCTLPAGTAIGTYALSYTATVNASATGSISNAVVGTGNDNPTCGGECSTNEPFVVPVVAYSKAATLPANKTSVSAGDTIAYTLSVTVSAAPTTAVVTLTDTLQAGLTFGAVSNAGSFTCNAVSPLVCTLPAGTAIGTYPLSYTATVDPTANGILRNVVVATGPDNPVCTASCTTETPSVRPVVTYSKAATLSANQTTAQQGQVITYTLTATVSVVPTTALLTLTDTLGPGLTFASVSDAGAYTCNAANPLVCTLPAGSAVGTYALSYTATVDVTATGTLRNVVVGTGGDDPTCVGACSTETGFTVIDVPESDIVVTKLSLPASGTLVERGQVIQYTLGVSIATTATTSELRLTDTPDPGLTIGALPAGCSNVGATIVCILSAGTPVGSYNFNYSGTVNENAGTTVGNVVTASGGSTKDPVCATCSTSQKIGGPDMRISKVAGAREVKLGDLVPYTLQVDNTGDADLVNAYVVDTPPAGFTYVAGSLRAAAGVVAAGNGPVRFSGVTVAAGDSTTLLYLMRVGAGARPGTQVNQAQGFTAGDEPLSNIATAQVILLANDPLTDESLLLGTVFDDRDGDGWQDRADLSNVHVQGGFAPDAYVPGSTTVDRGAGPKPQLDASAPLLRGLALGSISARQSEADAAENHQIVVSQRLRTPAFTDDFVLTTGEGITVRMDAQGRTSVTTKGATAKELSGAAVTAERHVEQSGSEYTVTYAIQATGIDERGIPGVRLASVEGLLIETDQYGRFHLAGIRGGPWERGGNFLLKVDSSTLPAGTQFTTDQSQLRRLTPGVPVRFDFGVKLPVEAIPGISRRVELEIGRVLFDPGSSKVRPKYLPVIGRMAARVREFGGGEVVIDANADAEALAFERALAVKQALLEQLDAPTAAKLTVSVRAKVDDPSSLVIGVDEGGALLGTVLFDTAKANIRPEFAPLLDRVARELNRMGGGHIAIVGHTDVRGSLEYNTELGMRRARAVYEALSTRLTPEVLAKIRIDSSNNIAAPVENPKH